MNVCGHYKRDTNPNKFMTFRMNFTMVTVQGFFNYAFINQFSHREQFKRQIFYTYTR